MQSHVAVNQSLRLMRYWLSTCASHGMAPQEFYWALLLHVLSNLACIRWYEEAVPMCGDQSNTMSMIDLGLEIERIHQIVQIVRISQEAEVCIGQTCSKHLDIKACCGHIRHSSSDSLSLTMLLDVGLLILQHNTIKHVGNTTHRTVVTLCAIVALVSKTRIADTPLSPLCSKPSSQHLACRSFGACSDWEMI